MSRRHRDKPNGLALRHPVLGVLAMLDIADVAVPKPSCSVHVGAPVPEAPPKPTVRPKITPDQKPITWADYF